MVKPRTTMALGKKLHILWFLSQKLSRIATGNNPSQEFFLSNILIVYQKNSTFTYGMTNKNSIRFILAIRIDFR